MTKPESAAWRSVPYAVTLVVTVVVLGPLYAGRGIALRGDMVFVPDQPWKPAGLGLDGSVPRAVPMDAIVSLLDEVVPGAVLQRLFLTVALVAGGFGIARLARGFHVLGQVAAVLVYLWNPWVHERLAIGQWPAVLAYGLLPWLVASAARAREGAPGGWSATYLLLALTGACAPSMGLIGTFVAVAVVIAGRSWSRGVAVVGLAATANLPWVLPALMVPEIAAGSTPFSAFAARGESALGTVASVTSMGGIWKTSVVPPERTHVFVVAVAGLLALAFVIGFRHAVPVLGRSNAAGIVVAAAIAALLALLPAVGPTAQGLDALSRAFPPLGILRDSHRYLAPFGLVLALGASAVVDWWMTARRGGSGVALVAVLLAAPVVLLPSLAWGLAGGLRPVAYPPDWTTVADRIAAGPGATVVLPWTGSYRGYAWNDRRAVLDPAPRFLPGDVLVDDRIFLGNEVLPSEDPFLVQVGEAVGGPDAVPALRALGVRWVLVEKGNGVRPSEVPAAPVVYDGRWLTLLDLRPMTRDVRHLRATPPQGIVQITDGCVLFAVCVSILRLGAASLVTRRYLSVWCEQRVFGRGRQGGSTT
jgi:hypothetical protein